MDNIGHSDAVPCVQYQTNLNFLIVQKSTWAVTFLCDMQQVFPVFSKTKLNGES